MVGIILHEGLPCVPSRVTHGGRSIDLGATLIDTGSGGTVLPAEKLAEIGVIPEPLDVVRRIRGVGGSEFVVTKTVDALEVAGTVIEQAEIQIGAMEYGFDLDGIIGMDTLLSIEAVIDLGSMSLGGERA